MRIVTLALGLVALGVLGYRMWLGAQAPEDLIRWRIEDAVEGFNETSMSPCLAVMTPTFVEETSGFQRGEVKQVIAAAFFGRVDPDTGEYLLRLELEDLEILVEEQTAKASFLARLFERRGEEYELSWEFELEGDLEDGDEGWRFVRAAFRTTDGRIPR